MSDKDDNTEDFEFDIEAAEKAQAEKKAGESDESETPPDPEKVIADLNEQLKKQREATEEANKRAADAESNGKKQVNSAQEDAFTQRKTAVDALLKSTETEIEAAERNLEEALTIGDAKNTVKFQKELSKLTYKYESISSDKQKLEYWKEQQDAQASQVSEIHPATQAWIANNPRFNTDQEFQNEAIAADGVARRMGIVPNSPAYFDFVDKRLGKIFSEDEESKPRQQKVQSAPPSRESANHSAKKDITQIRLTPAEREAASDMEMSEEDYKKYKYIELPKRNKGKR